jgi:hypothetical protein
MPPALKRRDCGRIKRICESASSAHAGDHFDDATNRALARRVADALEMGGVMASFDGFRTGGANRS